MSKIYDFKQAVRVGRATFPLGLRQVPAELEKHPHFQKFLKAGSVRVAGQNQVAKSLADLPVLPPASSQAAKRSVVSAQAIERGPTAEVAPDTELGESAEEVSADAEIGGDEDKEPKSKGKNKGRK